MIIFVDDERTSVLPFIDEFENIRKLNDNPNYETKYFFYGAEALVFLKALSDLSNVNLIVLDIMMDYGDKNYYNPMSGGVQFLKEYLNDNRFSSIPILIYSVKTKQDVEEMFGDNPFDNERINYLNKSTDFEADLKVFESIIRKPV